MPESPESTRLMDPLIEAAVRPLAGNRELHVAAEGFLETLRTKNGDGAAEALARWDEVDSRKGRRAWRHVIHGLFILTTVLLVWGEVGRFSMMREWVGWLGEFGFSYEETSLRILKRVASRTDGEQRFLLFGDASPGDIVGGRRSVWEKTPDDASLYASYVASHLTADNRLPDGYLETVRRIDPDNAWFIYLAAAQEARDSLKRVARTSRKVDGKRVYDPRKWEIQKQEGYAKALTLIQEAGRLPRCENYQVRNLQRIVASLPQENLTEYVDSIGCLGTMTSSGSLRLRVVVDVISAAAWQAGEAGDVVAYAAMRDEGERFIRRLMQSDPATVLDELVLKVVAGGLAAGFAETSDKLGLAEESERWKTLEETWVATKEANGRRGFLVDGKPADDDRVNGLFFGSGLAGLQRQLSHPPPISNRDLRPGRMLDHELASWFFCWAVWLVMLLMLACFSLYQFRIAGLVRDLAKRFECLLKPVDWMWILGAGVLLPFLYVMGINRLTPWGGHDYGIAGTYLLLPTMHFAGLIVLWLIASWMIIRIRLARRAKVFGFSGPGWLAAGVLMAAVAFIPVIGMSVIWEVPDSFWLELAREIRWLDADPSGSPWLFRAAAGLLAIPLLWLMIAAGCGLVGGKGGMLRQAVVARVMMPVCAVAMMVCSLATLAFKRAEHYWYSQDTPMKMDVSKPGWTSYEYQCAVQMREELRELLGEGY